MVSFIIGLIVGAIAGAVSTALVLRRNSKIVAAVNTAANEAATVIDKASGGKL